MSTPVFKFLDICSYVSPETSYEKWVKTYGTKLSKSWLPYEWFDCADKLDFEGLPPYRYWFPKQEKQFSLSLKEYEDCQRVFRERGMKTLADWLHFYNNLAVEPFLDVLESTRDFYTGLGILLFKDALSLPGVSMKYLLRGTLNQREARSCTP